MVERYEIYKCEICGNVVEVLHGGVGRLVCCGQPMKLMEAQTEEQGYEKHLPVVEWGEGRILVKVGSVPHPMEEKHYIELVEVLTTDGKVIRKYLNPGDKPEADFVTDEEISSVREYCNIHGLWVTRPRT